MACACTSKESTKGTVMPAAITESSLQPTSNTSACLASSSAIRAERRLGFRSRFAAFHRLDQRHDFVLPGRMDDGDAVAENAFA